MPFRPSFPGRRLGLSAALLVSLSISFAYRGCSSGALRSWGTDEVVLYGAGTGPGETHRDFSVMVSVKNIEGLKNGRYQVRPPISWEMAPRRTAHDGIDDVLLPAPVTLTDANNNGGWGWWDIKVA